MAADDKTPGNATATAPEPEQKETAPTYESAYLIRNSRALLKCSQSVAAGALSAAKGNQKNFTVAEATDLIKAHRKRPVEFATSGDDA